MGHGAGTNLAGLDFLTEVLHRNILPEVAVKVNDDGIDTLHSIKDGAQAVVVTNLGSVLFTFKAQLLGNELRTELTPVVLGVCHMVSVEVTCSTAELGCYGALTQGLQLTLQTIYEYHYLLAQTGGAGRLSVCLCQHGDVLPLLGIGSKLFYQLLQEGIVNLLECFLNTQGDTGVVDVLRSKTKMDKLLVGL